MLRISNFERIMDQILSLQETEQRAGKQLANPRPRLAEGAVSLYPGTLADWTSVLCPLLTSYPVV